jgi:hypothetical protein
MLEIHATMSDSVGGSLDNPWQIWAWDASAEQSGLGQSFSQSVSSPHLECHCIVYWSVTAHMAPYIPFKSVRCIDDLLSRFKPPRKRLQDALRPNCSTPGSVIGNYDVFYGLVMQYQVHICGIYKSQTKLGPKVSSPKNVTWTSRLIPGFLLKGLCQVHGT